LVKFGLFSLNCRFVPRIGVIFWRDFEEKRASTRFQPVMKGVTPAQRAAI
jgi:hypothetical protein